MTRGLTFPQLAEALLLGALAVCALLMSAPPDTYWHLRAGREIWQTGHVPLIDHDSYTANGHAWPDHEWLWQALWHAFYRAGGVLLLVAGGTAIVTSPERADGWRTAYADRCWAVLTAPVGPAP